MVVESDILPSHPIKKSSANRLHHWITKPYFIKWSPAHETKIDNMTKAIDAAIHWQRDKTTNLSFLTATAEGAAVSLAPLHLVVNLLQKNTDVADDDEGRR